LVEQGKVQLLLEKPCHFSEKKSQQVTIKNRMISPFCLGHFEIADPSADPNFENKIILTGQH
jgi:hypothetical protein